MINSVTVDSPLSKVVTPKSGRTLSCSSSDQMKVPQRTRYSVHINAKKNICNQRRHYPHPFFVMPRQKTEAFYRHDLPCGTSDASVCDEITFYHWRNSIVTVDLVIETWDMSSGPCEGNWHCTTPKSSEIGTNVEHGRGLRCRHGLFIGKYITQSCRRINQTEAPV